jgi:hypothetical protein
MLLNVRTHRDEAIRCVCLRGASCVATGVLGRG